MSNHKNTVASYFRDFYRIEAIPTASKHKVRRYRHAITQLHVYLQSEAFLWEIGRDTLDAFEKWMAEEGYGVDARRNYRLCIQRIMHHARPEVFPRSTPADEGANPVVKANANPFVPVDLKPDPSMPLLRFVTDVYSPIRHVSKKTVLLYNNSVRSLQRHHKRQIQVGEFSNELILPWLAERYEKLSPHSVKRHRGDVLTLWRFAHRKGFCPIGPVDVPELKTPRRIPEAWTLEEFGRIVSAAQRLRGEMGDTGIKNADWWTSLLLFIFDTSTRISATLAIRGEDIDLARRHVILQPENAKTDLCQIVGFSEQTRDALARHFEATRDFVWPYPFNSRAIWIHFKLILAAAGMPSGRRNCFHKIRRTSATMIATCISLEAARQQLGHTRPEMTLSTYVDPRQMGTNVADLMPRPFLEGGAA